PAAGAALGQGGAGGGGRGPGGEQPAEAVRLGAAAAAGGDDLAGGGLLAGGAPGRGFGLRPRPPGAAPRRPAGQTAPDRPRGGATGRLQRRLLRQAGGGLAG